MPNSAEQHYKVVVFLPPDYLDRVMAAANGAMKPIYPNYDMVFSYQTVKGCWRPLDGADPYQGSIGELEVADELRLEFTVAASDLRRVVDAVIQAHPYEEPGIDVYPVMTGRGVWASSL